MVGNSRVKNKLLLIDDEQDIARILKAGLENAGYKVDVYNDSRKALDNYKPDHYERIITDIRMPNMNGFELARKIWAVDPKADVCFLSSFEIHEREAKKIFSNHKNHCFVTKPVTPSQLVKHIEAHLIKNDV
jgi:DNA-binding response OmpR family regulator